MRISVRLDEQQARELDYLKSLFRLFAYSPILPILDTHKFAPNLVGIKDRFTWHLTNTALRHRSGHAL